MPWWLPERCSYASLDRDARVAGARQAGCRAAQVQSRRLLSGRPLLAVILIPVHTAKCVAVAVVAATVPVAGVIPVASIVIALTPVAIVDAYHCSPAERCDQHADNKNNLHCPNLRKMRPLHCPRWIRHSEAARFGLSRTPSSYTRSRPHIQCPTELGDGRVRSDAVVRSDARLQRGRYVRCQRSHPTPGHARSNATCWS